MSSQRFCLRWNNHQTNLLSVFDQLLHAETFTDVTLAVEGQLLKAHKMVLSACSPYFQALFVNHQEKHPIVILKDVPYSDMKSLLDFMYRGEVSVDQERLTAFLRVAESLRIKGLTEVNEDKSESSSLCGSLGPPPQLHRLHRERDRSIQHQQQQMNQQNNAGLLLPLLGGGSMQPKRKRGRPRKLSGGEEMLDQNVVRTVEPERLEVSVGAESFQTDEPPSGDEEALLIDEGDDMHRAQSPQNHSEHHAGNTPPGLLTPKSEPSSEGKLHSALAGDLMQGKIRINPLTQTATTSANALELANPDQLNNNSLPRAPIRRRVRRRANSASNDPAEQLTEMSVRGLNLFRYASVNEGVYQCTECAKENIQKTFKNKYSFQRHAFLYHEGKQRKVFPCPVCCKEFSRPDKMKNHMKTTHECYMPKDCVFPPSYFLMGGMDSPIPPSMKMDSPTSKMDSPVHMPMKMDSPIHMGMKMDSPESLGLKMELAGRPDSSPDLT